MRRSIFGCRGELTVGVGRYRSDLLGRRLLGGRLFRRGLFRGGLFFGCLCRRCFLRGFGGSLFRRRLAGRRFAGGRFLGRWLLGLLGWLLGGWRGRLLGGWRRVRGRGCAQGWVRRGVGRVVRSILRVCHPAAPLPFLVGCTGPVEPNPSCQGCVRGFAGVGQGLFRMDHSAAPPTRTTAPRTKGQIGTSSAESSAGCAAGPGVPVPAAVSRKDHDPETTCPSAEVTR